MPQPWSHLTVICQDICWTKLTLTTQSGAQEYCFFTSMRSEQGGHLHEQHFNKISAWSSWPSRENQLQNVFKRVWLIRQPERGYDSGFRFILVVCNIYSRTKALHRQCVRMNEATHGSGTEHSMNLLPGGRWATEIA